VIEPWARFEMANSPWINQFRLVEKVVNEWRVDQPTDKQSVGEV